MTITAARTPWAAVARAEMIRTRGSLLAWLPLLGVPLAGVSSLLGLAAGVTDATGILWWQGMYLTGMAAPLLGVFAAVAEGRERRARFGGVAARPVPPWRIRAGRLLGVLVAVAAFHLITFGVTALAAVSVGGGNTGRIALVGLLAFLGSAGTVALGAVLTRVTGLTWTVIVLAGWQLAGTLAAEAARWWVFPPAWPVRLVLPALGTHANLVPLEPGAPLAGERPWAALALSLGFAAVMAAVALVVPDSETPRRRRRGPAGSRGAALVGKRPAAAAGGDAGALGEEQRRDMSLAAALRALHLVFRGSAAPALMAAAAALIALTALTYPPGYVHGLVVFALLPLGTAVLPMVTWRLLAPGWQVLVTENVRVRAGLVLWHLLAVAAMCVLAAVAALAAGEAPGAQLRRLLLAVIVGWVLVAVALSLAVRFSAAVAALAGVAWTVASATLGGDLLAGTWLWFLAPPAWPETAADSPLRAAVAALVGGGLLVGAVAAASSALRRHERKGRGGSESE